MTTPHSRPFWWVWNETIMLLSTPSRSSCYVYWRPENYNLIVIVLSLSCFSQHTDDPVVMCTEIYNTRVSILQLLMTDHWSDDWWSQLSDLGYVSGVPMYGLCTWDLCRVPEDEDLEQLSGCKLETVARTWSQKWYIHMSDTIKIISVTITIISITISIIMIIDNYECSSA